MRAPGDGSPPASPTHADASPVAAGARESRADEHGHEGSRVLIVAVASQALSPQLVEAVRARAAAGDTSFYLVLPDPAEHAELTAAQRRQSFERGRATLEQSLSLLSDAAGSQVEGAVSVRHDLMDVVEETLQDGAIDEVMLAITHHRLAERMHLDLPHRVEHLGYPVTTIVGDER